MFKKTMTFDNLDGEEVTQTFYFNYNKKEIAELLEFKQLEEKLRLLTIPVEESGLSQRGNNQQAYDIFQDLILDAFGKKGDDNVTFVKNDELRNYWKSHVAFVELIWEFLENPPLAAEFIENCLPAKMVAKAKEEMVAESKGQISSGTLAEMVQEADRRQKDPATRIEPGPEAAAEALGESPTISKLAESIKDDTTPETKVEDLTPQNILEMDDISFQKLDPKKLDKDQMLAAFRRKSKA
jgi:hypothetical protein